MSPQALTSMNTGKKSFLLVFLTFWFFLFWLAILQKTPVLADDATPTTSPLVIPCLRGTCPSGTSDEERDQVSQVRGECVETYDKFTQDPINYHYWATDQEVTEQGKADERARQFIYWVLQNKAIDNHPTLFNIWKSTRNIAYFLLVLVAAVMGIGMIISKKTSFGAKIQIWPAFFKIFGLLLYITFSAAILITIIQLSENLMKFFIEKLGGNDIFNIYFADASQEKNYVDWIGCRDLNWKVQEAAKTELFLLKFTNITYYVMGVMLLLRKIVLWFLLFVSPFLAVLLAFSYIKNVGLIWIGVFFQWVFYGPLFALFLGALSTIWRYGLPFVFDFSRAGKAEGYIFPTATSILYGGPSQKLNFLNSGNYIDTFVEYVITLIMLWAVVFLPWWLLRIFRDYCCDGIYAAKNILMSMYDHMRNRPPSAPHPTTPPSLTGTTTSVKTPREVEIPIRVRLQTIEEIRKTTTEDISKSLNLRVSKLADITHFETNKQVRENFNNNLNYLKNPQQAQTSIERQKYMNIKTELFNRSLKQDRMASHVLSMVAPSRMEQIQQRDNFVKNIPQATPVTHVVSVKVNMTQDKVSSITSSLTNNISNNNSAVNNIAEASQSTQAQVSTVLSALTNNINQPATQIAQNISDQTKIDKNKVVTIIKNIIETTKTNKKIVEEVAEKENVKVENVQQLIDTQIPLVAEAERHIEQTVSIPPSVSIEDYEEVKTMWTEQYEKGEIPLSENIKTRDEWIDKDIVFITNTLNKLLATDEELRHEGMDDLGYILPVFMINNLKSEELLVYLKAKVEAAKAVQSEMQKEKTLKAKLEAKSQEELIEVEKPKAQEEKKAMHMEEEIKPEEKKEEQSELIQPTQKENKTSN